MVNLTIYCKSNSFLVNLQECLCSRNACAAGMPVEFN